MVAIRYIKDKICEIGSESMFNKVKPAYIFIFTIILTGIFITFTVMKYNNSGEYLNNDKLHEFEKQWIYVDASKKENIIALPTQVNCEVNETVTLKNTIPITDLEEYSICFRSKQQFVKVLVDGEEIFSYGDKGSRLTKAPASAWQMIHIKKSYEGKEITIQLRSPYARYTGVVSKIVYCNKYDYQACIFKTYLPGFVVSCIIIAFGIFILLISILAVGIRKKFLTLFYISMCAILIGCWSLGESRLIQFINGNLDIMLMMMLLSLMLAPFPYLLFMRGFVEKRHRIYIDALIIIKTLNFVRCIIASLLQWKDLIENLNSALILGVTSIATVHIILLYEYLKSKERKSKLYLASYLSMNGILLIFTILEVWSYQKEIFKEYGLFWRIGVLLYMAVLTLLVVVRYLDLITEANELREKLLNSQITLMLSQIKPHFLYNTLTAIRTLIKKKPDEAYTLVGHFSKYLRANLHSINSKEMIPFAEELNHIKTYVNIELVRFNHQFEVIYDINIEDFYVPPLSIQPIVENAIKHGVCKMAKGGIVTIRTRQLGESIIVEVIDNGIGFNASQYELDSQEKEDKKHVCIGIDNIKMRLRNICNASINIHSIEGSGTIVTVVLSKNVVQQSNYD
jgi:two-component system, LytTR family, sensor kinase